MGYKKILVPLKVNPFLWHENNHHKTKKVLLMLKLKLFMHDKIM